MEHFVTVFDSKYLPQGLALHESMVQHCGEFMLWVVCMDEMTRVMLENSGREATIRCIAVEDIESAALREVRGSRTIGEYCWTVTPFSIAAVLTASAAPERVTYVDADLWFRGSPERIFREFDEAGSAVLITEHAFTPSLDTSATAGQYCVQFMTFRRDRCLPVLEKWQRQCLEWCFNRFEEGRFGDQKYLDDWPSEFGGLVHVLRHPEWTLAPWNANRFPYSGAIFYHFHGLRIRRGRSMSLGTYYLPKPLLEYVYAPYALSLRHVMIELDTLSIDDGRPWRRQASEPAWRVRVRYWRQRFRHLASISELALK
jgi:hypothetical protein